MILYSIVYLVFKVKNSILNIPKGRPENTDMNATINL
jgi:hypothetical protein